MTTLATAAEVANLRDEARRQSDGSYRMCCVACGSENPTALSIKDGDDGLLVHCFKNSCKWQDILRALEDVTGLLLLREKGGVGKSGRRPRKVVKRVESPKQQAAKVKQQQDGAEKQRLCDALRRAGSQGPFDDAHPAMRYLLKKEAHACWASGVPLPVPYVPVKGLPEQLRSLVDKGQGAVGCLLGSFRLKPGGDPAGVQRVILDDQGQTVSKLSLGKQEGLVWLEGDDPACEGSLYFVEGILDAIRVLSLLDGQQGRVACTAGSLKKIEGKVEKLLPTLQQFDRIVLIPDGDNAGHAGALDAYVSMRAAGVEKVDLIAISDGEDPASVSSDWLQGMILDDPDPKAVVEPVADPEPIQEAVDDPDPVPSQRSAGQDSQEQELLGVSCSDFINHEGLSWMDGVRVPGRHRCGSCYRLSSELRLVFVGDGQQQAGWCPWCIEQGRIQYVVGVEPAAFTQQGVVTHGVDG